MRRADGTSIAQARGVADQVNAFGDVDAVIYNAAVGPDERRRIETADGLSYVFEINVLAPYILTALIARPRRVIYLTSGLHRGGEPALDAPSGSIAPGAGRRPTATASCMTSR